VKLSMMSYTMARQPQYFTLKGMFELTRDLSLDGLDMVSLYDKDARELRQMADDFGVPIVAHTFFCDLNFPTPAERAPAVDKARRSLADARTLGAPLVMIPTPAKAGLSAGESRRNWIAGLAEVAPLASDAGVVLTVENFPGEASPFVRAADLLEAIAVVPGLKITFDNGNAATGEPPAESFRRSAAHVVHSHFKDWDAADSETAGFRRMLDGRFYRSALIGEGTIDHRGCLLAMKAAGYPGYVNIEYEGNTYPPADAMRRATAYLRQLAAEIGW
jgi:sugar phosphate isomerase/epimerase